MAKRSQAVHIKSPWATGAIGNLVELITWFKAHPFLAGLGIVERIAKWLTKHYWITILTVLTVYAWIKGAFIVMILVCIMTMVGRIVYLYWREWGNYPSPTFKRLTYGIWRVNRVRRKWPRAARAGGFTTTRPKLTKLTSSPNGVIGKVATGKVGFAINKLAEGCDEIAAVMGADECKVEPIKPGEAYMHLIWGDPTSRLLSLGDIEQSPDIRRVGFGLDPNGYTVTLSLTTSVLIVGESESGKSNTMWAIIAGMIKKEIPFKLRVIDPAGGVELNRLQKHLSPLTLSYTDSANDIDRVVDYALLSMHERMKYMQENNIRKHTPTEDEPLEILLIDELLLLRNHDAQSPLAEIISTGRKASHIVIALSQLSQVDSLGRVRDLFPQRICLATKSAEMTDAVLGPGAERDGARCSRIGKDTPGVGYYWSMDRRLFTRFRTPEVTDGNANDIARGQFPEPRARSLKVRKPIVKSNRGKLSRRRTAVYRLYNSGGDLLYIGKTVHPNRRFKEHAEEQMWWADVDMSKTDIQWYPNWRWAGKVEIAAIKAERPRYNVASAPLAVG